MVCPYAHNLKKDGEEPKYICSHLQVTPQKRGAFFCDGKDKWKVSKYGLREEECSIAKMPDEKPEKQRRKG